MTTRTYSQERAGWLRCSNCGGRTRDPEAHERATCVARIARMSVNAVSALMKTRGWTTVGPYAQFFALVRAESPHASALVERAPGWVSGVKAVDSTWVPRWCYAIAKVRERMSVRLAWLNHAAVDPELQRAIGSLALMSPPRLCVQDREYFDPVHELLKGVPT